MVFWVRISFVYEDFIVNRKGMKVARPDSDKGKGGGTVLFCLFLDPETVACDFPPPQAHIWQAKKLFPRVGSDAVAKERSIATSHQPVGSSLLTICPARGQIDLRD
jgi:hypothetical protein